MAERRLKLLTGNANPALAREIAEHLGAPLVDATVGRFRDGEINLKIRESLRGADVFVIQGINRPTHDNLMELLIMLDACRRASVRSAAAVIPYYGYARQDRKTGPRDPIVAKLVANLIATAGAHRVLTMDLHAGQIQGFFDIPVDNLRALPILVHYFLHLELSDPIVVSPDVGGVTRAREFSQRLGCPLAIIDKRRPEPNVAKVMHVIGEVAGRTAIIVDDIIDTGGTVVEAAEVLLQRGARDVYACCTHAVFSPPAVDRLVGSAVREVVVTNTIPVGEVPPKIRVLSVAALFGEAIRRTFEEVSVSRLFEEIP